MSDIGDQVRNSFGDYVGGFNRFRNALVPQTPDEVGNFLAYNTPVVGNALSANDAYNALANRDYRGAAMSAIGALPFMGGMTRAMRNQAAPLVEHINNRISAAPLSELPQFAREEIQAITQSGDPSSRLQALSKPSREWLDPVIADFNNSGSSALKPGDSFRSATQDELDNLLYEAGAKNMDQLRLFATEGRSDAAEWNNASRRADKLEMDAINKAYGNDYEGRLDSARVEPFYSDEFHDLQDRMSELQEKYGVGDRHDLATFAKGAPQALTRAEKLHERLQRGQGR